MNRVMIQCKALFVAYFLLALSPAVAAVKFDGLTWYISRDSSRLLVNDQGRLVWMNPEAPDQLTVQLPPLDFRQGDLSVQG